MAEANRAARFPARCREATSTFWLVLRESVRSFFLNSDFDAAATLACYGFFSLMPLLLLVVYLLSVFVQSSEKILSAIGDITEQIFPNFSDAILKEVLVLSHQRVWGFISIALLLWSITPFVGAMRNALRRIIRSDASLSFLKAKLLDLAAVIALLLLFVFLSAGKVFSVAGILPGRFQGHLAFDLIRTFGVLVVTAGIIAFFYVAFSPIRFRFTSLIGGSVVATILLAVIRPVFGWFLHFNPNYGYVFGSLKAVFLLIIWVYYTFAVVLYGAEVVAAIERKEALLLRGLFLAPPHTRKLSSPLLARFVRTLSSGEVLFREGETGSEMLYVLAGCVHLSRGGHELAVMNPGDYFGEMSLLLNAPRTATATVASEDAQVVAISQANLDLLLRDNPQIVRAILKEMAVRLRNTDEQLHRVRVEGANGS